MRDPPPPSVTILLGRWQDTLPGAYDPAKAVVITDPPYGLGAEETAWRPMGYRDRGYTDAHSWASHVAEVLEKLPALRHVIRGPASAMVLRDYPAPRRLCVEVATYRRRAAHRPHTVPHLWQGWAVYGRVAIGHRKRPTNGDARLIRPYTAYTRTTNGARHGGITPWEAAVWIVETWGEPGTTILDPFAGIGTIGAAAAMMDLSYLGAEVDPDWQAEGVRLLASRQLPLPMPW